MTDRLSVLLHEEADRLSIPSPSAHHSIARGKRLRRRSRTIGAVSVLAVAAITAVVLMNVLANAPQASDPPIARDPAVAEIPVAYAIGSEVYLGDKVATVPHTVHSLHYTSVGVLVRSNPNDGASDGSGPENLTLVRLDGSTVDLGVVPEGVGPATDPGQSVYALARATNTGFEAVIREATTGEVVKTLALPDLPASYWPVTPLSLSGDTLFAHYESSMAAINVKTGESSVVPDAPGGLIDVAGSFFSTSTMKFAEIRRTDGGLVQVSKSLKAGGSFDLSPDGRYGLLIRDPDYDAGEFEEPTSFEVYGTEIDSFAIIEGSSYQWGWTGSSDLFTVKGTDLTVCQPDTGTCETTPAPAPATKKTDVKLGGRTYES
jgi:hypothetical protein